MPALSLSPSSLPLAGVLAAAGTPAAGDAQLVVAALLGIATVVVLITVLRVHPFLSLVIGSAVLGLVATLGPSATVDSFTKGVGSTVGSVGLLIALGAMIGGLLADSGGADTVVRRVVERVPGRGMPWAMAGVAALIGLPLFFEVGVVLLVPVILLVVRRSRLPLMSVGIPALAGLSVLHGLVPPHPGPLVAISALHADLGLTLLFGLAVAVPAVIIAGPLFARVAQRWVPAEVPAALVPEREPATVGAAGAGGSGAGYAAASADLGEPDRDQADRAVAATAPAGAEAYDEADDAARARLGGEHGDGAVDLRGGSTGRRPSFLAAVLTTLLPVLLMLARAVGELTLTEGSAPREALDDLGNPVVALLIGVLVAMVVLGGGAGLSRRQVSDSLSASLPPIAGILLIVAAGGGFKQVLVDAGVGDVIKHAATGVHFPALVLGWLVAVGIRLATGSATVATITAAGIVAPLGAALDRPHLALLALAVGAGSLFFSHVNDAGFWLVKEYFGLTVGQTIKSWSVMETIISVIGLGGVLILSALV